MRNIWKFKWLNDGFRSLNESIIYPEVAQTLLDWKKNSNTIETSVLIGGLALSYYLKPRATEDIDLIFLTKDSIPNNVIGFTRPREHAFRHIKTHVEVEVLDPDFLNTNKELFELVFEESVLSDGIRVASPRSLIALKLNRFSPTDRSDIINLIKYCKSNEISLDLEKYNLSEESLNNFKQCLDESDNYSQNMHMLECYSLLNDGKYKVNEIDNDTGYDIFITNEKYYDVPSFYFGKNIGKRIMKFDDFSYLIKIPKDINEELEVIYSSTDYKSFVGRKKDELILKEWLKVNINKLNEKWNLLNS